MRALRVHLLGEHSAWQVKVPALTKSIAVGNQLLGEPSQQL
jgi:hypothetical protein